MADVIKKVSGLCDVYDYRQSVNTPDFPTADWVINPVLTSVQLEEITDVTAVADVASSLDATHFLIDSDIPYYVWIDVDNLSVDPAPVGRTGIEVDISANDAATVVAAAIQAAVDASISFSASVLGAVVTITTADPADVTDAVDVDTGFTVTVTQQGINFPQIHWKVVGTSVVPKTAPEIAATDSCLLVAGILLDTLTDFNSAVSEPMSFLNEDPNRPGKVLTVDTTSYTFNSLSADDLDFFGTITPIDADSGYRMPYDGTIVRAQIHVVEGGGLDLDFDAYIDAADSGLLVNVSGSGQLTADDNLLDIDFSAGKKLRVRASQNGATAGQMLDLSLIVMVKWRLP